MNEQLKDILEQQLRDVQTPDAVSWWPLAIGWWLVIALTLTALTVGIIVLIRHRRRNNYRKLAISSLNQHLIVWQAQKNDAGYLQAANAVLKRTCLHFNHDAASLADKTWVNFLNAHNKTQLSDSTEIALAEQLYQANPNVDVENLHIEITTWLLKHTVVPSNQIDQSAELKHA